MEVIFEIYTKGPNAMKGLIIFEYFGCVDSS
jgi:hypothetical protein